MKRKTDYRYLPNAIAYYLIHDNSVPTIFTLGFLAGALFIIGVSI